MTIKTIFAVLALAFVVGCGVGDAPKPMSQSEVQDALAKASPQDQVKFIQSSPLNKADKQKKLDEIKTKYKLTDEDIAKMNSGPEVRTGAGN